MALTQYNGQGRCYGMEFSGDTADKYTEEVRSWAQRIDWEVEHGTWNKMSVLRKEEEDYLIKF